MNDNNPTPAAQPRKWPRRLLFGLQVLLAATFLNFGIGLVTGSGDTVQTFDDIGAGQWLRVVCGLLYFSAAIGLLIRWLAGPAALGLVGMMLGAAVVEIAVIDGGSPVAPLVLMAMLSVVAWFRRDTITALPARLTTVAATNPIWRRP
jgi:putative oxidoreductase